MDFEEDVELSFKPWSTDQIQFNLSQNVISLQLRYKSIKKCWKK